MSRFPKPRLWVPINKEKYEGDINNITSRSSWETKFLNWADSNSSVIMYSSEEVKIPYISPVDLKPHRYFVDFKIKVKTSTGLTKIYLVEIKPYSQKFPPKIPKRRSKSYLNECTTFMVNQAKWSAATQWSIERGWEFIVLTEKELF